MFIGAKTKSRAISQTDRIELERETRRRQRETQAARRNPSSTGCSKGYFSTEKTFLSPSLLCVIYFFMPWHCLTTCFSLPNPITATHPPAFFSSLRSMLLLALHVWERQSPCWKEGVVERLLQPPAIGRMLCVSLFHSHQHCQSPSGECNA